jgi:hypothetical protein
MEKTTFSFPVLINAVFVIKDLIAQQNGDVLKWCVVLIDVSTIEYKWNETTVFVINSRSELTNVGEKSCKQFLNNLTSFMRSYVKHV